MLKESINKDFVFEERQYNTQFLHQAKQSTRSLEAQSHQELANNYWQSSRASIASKSL